jgi:hypothetical protein
MTQNYIGLNFLEVLAIVFITLKLLKVIDWSWFLVLAPIWIPLLLLLVGLLIWLIIYLLIKYL